MFHLCRLVLSAVFATAGVAKLTDPTGTQRAAADFGLPRPVAPVLARVLPVVEIATALALLVPRWSLAGALAAMALLGVFTLGIAWSLSRGRTPNCQCFGQLHSSPVGLATLARNGVLLAASAFVAWRGAGRTEQSLNPLADVSVAGVLVAVLLLALMVAVGVEGWLLMNLLRQHGRVLLRLEALEGRAAQAGPAVGTAAPGFTLRSANGDEVTLARLRASGKPTLLVFSEPECQPCRELLPDLVRWQRDHGELLTIALVTRGVDTGNLQLSGGNGLVVLLEQQHEVSDVYGVSVMPTGVVILPDGTFGSSIVPGADRIRDLADQLVHGQRHDGVSRQAGDHLGHGVQQGAKRGDPVPDVTLPDLAGRPVSLRELEAETLLVFWSPTCPFCVELLPELKAWEDQPSSGRRPLVVVSTGTVGADTAVGVRSPVLVDEEFSVGTALGVVGTPAAVVVDTQGNLASDLVVGLPGVAGMLRSPGDGKGAGRRGASRRRR